MTWAKYKEIKKGGALLIRPDNFVAWRSLGPSKKGGVELVEAFRALIGGGREMVNGDMQIGRH